MTALLLRQWDRFWAWFWAWWRDGEDGHADDEIDDGHPGCQ